MKSILKITLAVFAVFILVSCKKDKENPTITIVEPMDHEEFAWGDELHVEAIFEDDRELMSYHIHLGNEAGDPAPEFNVDFSGTLSGKSYSFHEHAIVPDSVETIYYLHFEVTDVEGKITTQKLMLHFMQ